MIYFINNKYKTWYLNLIQRAKERQSLTGYTEKHHIIPKSLGGDNSDSNLVVLTAREHFVCHLLLAKCISGKERYKMYAAVAYFSNNTNRQMSFNSRQIALIREYNAKAASDRNKGNDYWKRRQPITDELRFSLGNAARNKTWVNDGVTEKLVQNIEQYMNNGFTRGRLSSHISNKFNGSHSKGKSLSEETKQKMRGPKHATHGSKVSEARKKMFKEMGGMTKYQCPHCGKMMSKTNLIRWHGDNCKSISGLHKGNVGN